MVSKFVKIIVIVLIVLLFSFFSKPRGIPVEYPYSLLLFLPFILILLLNVYEKTSLNRFSLAVTLYMIGMLFLKYTYPIALTSLTQTSNDIGIILPFYAIFIVIGIYTTFWTEAGFIGVTEDDPRVIRKNSLILLGLVMVMALGIVVVPELMGIWLFITCILCVSTSRHHIGRSRR